MFVMEPKGPLSQYVTGASSHSGCIPPSPKLSTFFQASRCRGSHDVQEGRENKTGTGDCEEPKALSVETPNWMAHNHNWLKYVIKSGFGVP